MSGHQLKIVLLGMIGAALLTTVPATSSWGQNSEDGEELSGPSPASENQPKNVPCSDEQEAVANRAQRAAFSRAFTAWTEITAVDTSDEEMRKLEQFQAKFIAKELFDVESPPMEEIADVMGTLKSKLGGKGIAFVCAATDDPYCSRRAAYVSDSRPPIHICPGFLDRSEEERIRTMVHEAAHLTRFQGVFIGEQVESYCGLMTCGFSCGGYDTADSWSHLALCLAAPEAADEPD